MGLDLCKGLRVYLDGISIEVLDVVGPLNASSVAAAQATSVDIAGPANMALELVGANTALQGDDVLVGNVLGLLAGGSSESGGEQSSEEESQTAKAMHLEE